MPTLACPDRALPAHLPGPVLDRGCDVRPLVGVDFDYDHFRSPFLRVATDDGVPADRPQWGRQATLLSGHAGTPRTAAGDRTLDGQTRGSTGTLWVSPAPAPSLTGVRSSTPVRETRVTLMRRYWPASSSQPLRELEGHPPFYDSAWIGPPLSEAKAFGANTED